LADFGLTDFVENFNDMTVTYHTWQGQAQWFLGLHEGTFFNILGTTTHYPGPLQKKSHSL